MLINTVLVHHLDPMEFIDSSFLLIRHVIETLTCENIYLLILWSCMAVSTHCMLIEISGKVLNLCCYYYQCHMNIL